MIVRDQQHFQYFRTAFLRKSYIFIVNGIAD